MNLLEAKAHDRQIALMKWLARQAKALRIGKHVYVVGGAVRNFIIDQPIKDIDMMIDALAADGRDSEWLAKRLQRAIPGKSNLVTNQYGVAILTVREGWTLDGIDMSGEVIEIANARTESYGGSGGKGYKPSKVSKATAKDDVSRREFTFNTLMWRLSELASGPEKAEIIDLTGCGLRDLKAGVMRCPSDPDKTFSDDPTRMLRAIKFLMKYGFRIDAETEKAIRRNAPKIRKAPWEAISKLLLDVILKEPKTAKKALREMERLGLLAEVSKMIHDNRAFAARLSGWASNKRVMFLFDMLDMGLPAGARMGFLSAKDQKRLREVASRMPDSDATRFLAALKQPGLAIQDKAWMPALMRERGLQGKEAGLFAKRVTEKARQLLLAEPELMQNPRRLRNRLREMISESSGLVEAVDLLLAEAVKFEFQSKSPLQYSRSPGRSVQRIVLIDSSSKDPSDQEYFRDLAPEVVGFLDFQKRPYGYYINYISVRPDMYRKGYARKLVEKFYERLLPEAKKKYKAVLKARKEGLITSRFAVDWGKMMQTAIGRLLREMREKHPEVDSFGKVWY